MPVDLTFIDLLALHVGYVVSSLILAAAFFALLFVTAYVFAMFDIAQERRTRRRKESHHA